MTFEDIAHAFFLIAAGQGVFLSILLFTKSENRTGPAYYLGWVMIIFSVILLFWIVWWKKVLSGDWFALEIMLAQTDLLLGPFLYFFIRSKIRNGYSFSRWDYLHFLPFTIFFLNALNASSGLLFGQMLYRLVRTDQDLIIYNNSIQIIRLIQFVAYSMWTFLLLRHYRKKWLLMVAVFYAIYCLGRITYYVLVKTQLLTLNMDYVISVVIVTAIYSISYIHGINPQLFRRNGSYSRSSLSFEHEPLICKKVHEHLKTEGVYLQAGFTLEQLAKEMELPKHHISQALNHHLGVSFSDLLNKMRIEKSIQLLRDPKNRNTRILTIALSSGYNNKVSFHQQFKKKTGLSPKAFRDDHFADENKVKSDNYLPFGE